MLTETTLVAAFRDRADAEAAAADLEAAGVSRANIYLESSGAAGVTSGTSDAYGSRTAQHEGGVSGWFKSLFGADEAETTHGAYQQTVEKGGYLLTVDASEEHLDLVESILNRHSPTNVTSEDNGEPLGETTTGYGIAGTTAATTTGSESIPVLQEDLQVGKRSVLRGGVRIFSRIVETPVQENIGLREEHVRVNRQAVNRPATEADFAAGRSQSVELEEYAEEAVVAKDARVVEEIRVGKEVSERTQTISDSVRHTEVEIENIPADQTKAKTTGR